MQRDVHQSVDYFLVCGLGNLGQYCVSVFKEFGVKVNGIEIIENIKWQIPDLPDLFDTLIIGDCRQPKVLEQADIRNCRAILIVTSDESVNIAAAFAARTLNPNIRLVIRSSQENLNDLLQQNLGNFVAFEATQLPAKSFAIAALGTETRGFFTIENRLLRVVRANISTIHPWLVNRQICELNNSHRRVLTHMRAGYPQPKAFYQWELDAKVLHADTVAYIEVTDNQVAHSAQANIISRTKIWRKLAAMTQWRNLLVSSSQWWQERSQTQRVAVFSGLFIASLLLCGTILYKFQYPQISWHDAINVSIVLSIGGYDNLFGHLQIPFPVPWWLHLFSISLTVGGTVFVGILYAILTERVLTSKFQFTKRRPVVPKADHVVLVGIGRVGQRVAKLLQELKQPLVAVNATQLDSEILPDIPLVIGNIKQALNKVNINTARSIVAVTDDEVANLEVALRVYSENPSANLVIRTFDPRFSENIAQLLPFARVMGAYALSAEAFVAAAFGENILSLFRLNDQTTLVAEYKIKTDDTLNNKLLAEVAYGYGVVPIMYQKATGDPVKFMPSDDIRLAVDDKLVILATIEELQKIEHGIIGHKNWLVRIEKSVSNDATFDGAAIISRISGCDMVTARTTMSQLPQTLQYPLYKHQAQRLVNELSKAQVVARVNKIN
ncbi:MAG: NAD-binding protein [Calothrix sp. C42_A2020_038]|nr:NAD-binding protein [Calothrix sp. C42_A2020_038]